MAIFADGSSSRQKNLQSKEAVDMKIWKQIMQEAEKYNMVYAYMVRILLAEYF